MKNLYLLGMALLCLSDLPAQVRKLAVIGSSTAAGQGAWPPDSAWVRRVDHLYRVEQNALTATYNFGVGGYDVYKGMPTTYITPGRPAPDPTVNITRAISELSDLDDPANGVVIVNYPSNGYVNYSISEIINCLQVIYDAAVAAGHKCYITTTQTRDDGAFASSEMKKKLADIKDAIISTFGIEHTLNFWDGMFNPADTTRKTEYAATGDLIHYNNDGHKEMFNRVVAKDVFGLNPLPVTIEQFSGALQNSSVELKWTAHYDDPHSYFIVQRSTNGIHFESLGKVNVNGNGKKTYQFEDAYALTGIVYYRLEIHEAARTYYSSVIPIKIPVTALLVGRIYPTRVLQTLTLEIVSPEAQRSTLEIISSNGSRLKIFVRPLQQNKNIITLPVSGLSSGSYFLRITSPGRSAVIRSFLK